MRQDFTPLRLIVVQRVMEMLMGIVLWKAPNVRWWKPGQRWLKQSSLDLKHLRFTNSRDSLTMRCKSSGLHTMRLGRIKNNLFEVLAFVILFLLDLHSRSLSCHVYCSSCSCSGRSFCCNQRQERAGVGDCRHGNVVLRWGQCSNRSQCFQRARFESRLICPP